MDVRIPVETSGAATPVFLAQEGPAGTEMGAPAGAPIIDGPAHVLWGGVAGVVLVFMLAFYFLLRGRLGASIRDVPATGRGRATSSEFFQPAGEGAEITFDDEPALRPRDPYVGELDDEPVDEVAIVPPSRPAAAGAHESEPERQTSPFAGIFARRRPEEAADAEFEDARPIQAGRDQRPQPANDPNPAVWLREEQDAAREHESRRRAAEEAEAARLAAERARAAAEAERRQAEADRLAAEREFEERKRAAAAEQRERALAEQERSLAMREATIEDKLGRLRREVADDLDARLTSVAHRLETRLADQAPHDSHGAERALFEVARRLEARMDALAENVDARISALRADAPRSDPRLAERLDALARNVAQDRAELSDRLARIAERMEFSQGAPADFESFREEMTALRRALSERVSGPTAPAIQLADIVRDTLPPDAFEMRAMLANNRRADCLIRLPHPPGPIAVDARFPLEALHRLHKDETSDRESAENGFRRTFLRHVVDIAEHLIIPGETAESALMFVPSESMFAELHARFADLVQDSFRARVWIVSPTTLMATLQTIRAVMRDAQLRESGDLIQSEARRVLAEVDALRRRVIALESEIGAPRETAVPVAGPMEPSWRDAGAPQTEYAEPIETASFNDEDAPAAYDQSRDDVEGEEDSEIEDADSRAEQRAPFPLR